ncbi:MAG TPA: DUF427 domain-containing protein [Caulobacteraceae bacterium]|jgi:uncharacterized protein (DUF427 family)
MPLMKTPGPDHPITLETEPRRMQARYDGHVIADSADVIILREADYPPVAYFPRGDVDMTLMARTSRSTHCPYKGQASYYTLTIDGRVLENAVWSYEEPYPAMTAIRDRLAFYPNIVEVQAVDEAVAPASADVGEVVRHTDAGDGTSQAPHWPPNVGEPRATR